MRTFNSQSCITCGTKPLPSDPSMQPGVVSMARFPFRFMQ